MDKSKIKQLAQTATVQDDNVTIKANRETPVSVDVQDIRIKGAKNTTTVREDDHSKLKHLDWDSAGHIGFVGIKAGTKEYWDSQRDYRPEAGLLICYTDYKQKLDENGDPVYDEHGDPVYLPGFKLGDGNAYLIDKPFLDETITQDLVKHINDYHVHITDDERARWNRKINCKEPTEDDKVVFYIELPEI